MGTVLSLICRLTFLRPVAGSAYGTAGDLSDTPERLRKLQRGVDRVRSEVGLGFEGVGVAAAVDLDP
jgi:hypothetical protein